MRRFLAMEPASRSLQLAGLLRFICIFLQGIILVKAGVPIAIVGQIEFVFFVANFFMFFWQNGTTNAMLSWASGSDRQSAAVAIFGGMHILACIAAVLLWITLLLPLGGKYEELSTGSGMWGLILFVFFSIPSGALTYVYLLREQYGRIIWFTVISQFVQVAVVVCVVVAGFPIQVLLWSLGAYACVRWVFVLLAGQWMQYGSLRRAGIVAFLAFCLPLILHALNGGIMDYVDGWIVSLFYGDDIFAIYRFGARELPLNALLVGGLVSGLVHRYKSQGGVDTPGLRQETLRIMNLLFPISCALILFSPLLYEVIYSEHYVTSARIFNIYAMTLLSRVILNQVYCYVHHRNWVLTWSTAIEVVLNIVLSILFMHWIGLPGIPLATVVAYLVQKSFLIWYVRHTLDVPFSAYVPVARFIWYFATMIACVFVAELLYF